VRKAGFLGLAEKIFRPVMLSNFYLKDKKACREALQLPQNLILAGCFCRIVEEKGLEFLVKALVNLPDNYGIVLVGSGSYKKTLVKIAEQLGVANRVYFFDSVASDKLVDYYNCLDVFILPSVTTPLWKEQYGMVLIEAMACGLPVLGSSSGAIPEVLAGYPRGLVFEEKNVEDLVKKIPEVLRLKNPEGFNLKTFLYAFSAEHFVKEHLKIFTKLLTND
jgi:glycosyltransferase involved in cell wall biosynthesis